MLHNRFLTYLLIAIFAISAVSCKKYCTCKSGNIVISEIDRSELKKHGIKKCSDLQITTIEQPPPEGKIICR